MKILIAEDDDVSAKLIETTLHMMDYETKRTSNGRDALDYFNHHRVPIIISDWMMPDMNGISLCEAIRKTTSEDYVYFIMLTARVGSENQKTAMECGVDDFLTKPLNPPDLLSRVRVAERIMKYTQHIRKLQDTLLTICMYTKRIKVNENEWIPIEKFFHERLGIDFSHGISPEAYEKVMASFRNADDGEDKEPTANKEGVGKTDQPA